jgi:hypothetical protein
LKVVAQAIPIYATSVFLLPKKVCKKITDIISSGEMMIKVRKCIDFIGGSYVFLRKKMAWCLKIYIPSILQCYVNKCGC